MWSEGRSRGLRDRRRCAEVREAEGLESEHRLALRKGGVARRGVPRRSNPFRKRHRVQRRARLQGQAKGSAAKRHTCPCACVCKCRNGREAPRALLARGGNAGNIFLRDVSGMPSGARTAQMRRQRARTCPLSTLVSHLRAALGFRVIQFVFFRCPGVYPPHRRENE